MAKKETETPASSPVTPEEIQRTVQAAKSLASIPGQELLEDPALNPATRERYDQLTAERLEAALQADHRRKLAEAAEQARQVEESAQVAAIIDQARRATSPAHTILDMSRHQRRFGRIYIVCATGRSAAELVADLHRRLGNPPEKELEVAAAEQAKITRLRLRKLTGEER